jgi:hypothetical protein
VFRLTLLAGYLLKAAPEDLHGIRQALQRPLAILERYRRNYSAARPSLVARKVNPQELEPLVKDILTCTALAHEDSPAIASLRDLPQTLAANARTRAATLAAERSNGTGVYSGSGNRSSGSNSGTPTTPLSSPGDR